MGKYRLKQGFGEHYRLKDGGLVEVKPGEVIECTDVEIAPFLDKFEVVEEHVPPKPASAFALVSLSHGWFDVIHPKTRKPINTKRLRKEEAEALAGKTVEEWEAEEAARIQKEADDAAEQKRLEEEDAANNPGQGGPSGSGSQG